MQYLQKKYKGIEMFIGRKNRDSLNNRNPKKPEGFNNSLISPRVPMSQTFRQSIAPSDPLKMSSYNQDCFNHAKNS